MLGPVQIRELADRLGVQPTKTRGQNFVHDAGTVRRIVRDAGVADGDVVLEVGPGLGSLTLALLEAGAYVSAVEIDPVLAGALPDTIAEFAPEAAAARFAVLECDALQVRRGDLAVPPELAGVSAGELAGAGTGESSAGASDGPVSEGTLDPTHLVANLPYNVAVPVLLTALAEFPSLRSVTVMVQLEVADRLAAQPGSRTYGVPSVKANWYGKVRRGAKISRSVFWPVPNVDSALVHLDVHEGAHAATNPDLRDLTFEIVDAAFAQRRKTLRAALAPWAGGADEAEEILRAAEVDPTLRGERLGVDDYVQIARAARERFGLALA
ncbi:Ribosomal RNA small subunit methyltransferase A [Trueperella bialowiezensis]|uniref:Ribosomal RNA small subunit methyltransferase A n=1 Tax=Trueperella bialowiezensis TaxID=312285 RepID=A0A448PDL8_9ACTO|nr:Ribosomal RNA small subunit methyltransferase A [Trueperella bialowiezensis]